jgi:hypothetical protein
MTIDTIGIISICLNELIFLPIKFNFHDVNSNLSILNKFS